MPSDPEDESMEPGVESELGLEYGGGAGLQLDDSRDLDSVGTRRPVLESSSRGLKG